MDVLKKEIESRLEKRGFKLIFIPEDAHETRRDKTYVKTQCMSCEKVSDKKIKSIFSSRDSNVRCRCNNKNERKNKKPPEDCVVICEIDNKYAEYLNLNRINPYYYVNNKGEIYSTGNGKLSKRKLTSDSDGYTRLNFQTSDDDSLRVHIHRIVYAAFGENVDMDVNFDDYQIDHINNSRSDNNISNLRLVTIKENMENRQRVGRQENEDCLFWDRKNKFFYPTKKLYDEYYKGCGEDIEIFHYKQYVERLNYENNIKIEDEKWNFLEEYHIDVSNYGRVKTKEGKITWGTVTESKYMNYCENKIHILVASAFIIKTDPMCDVVDHIDNCSFNNKASNIQWLTIQQNTQKAYDNNENSNKREIVMIKDDSIVCFNKIKDGALYIIENDEKYKNSPFSKIRGAIEACLYNNREGENHTSCDRIWYYKEDYKKPLNRQKIESEDESDVVDDERKEDTNSEDKENDNTEKSKNETLNVTLDEEIITNTEEPNNVSISINLDISKINYKKEFFSSFVKDDKVYNMVDRNFINLLEIISIKEKNEIIDFITNELDKVKIELMKQKNESQLQFNEVKTIKKEKPKKKSVEQNKEEFKGEVDYSLKKYRNGDVVSISEKEFEVLKKDQELFINNIILLIEDLPLPMMETSSNTISIKNDDTKIEYTDDNLPYISANIKGIYFLNKYMVKVMMKATTIPKKSSMEKNPTFEEVWNNLDYKKKLITRMVKYDKRLCNGSFYGAYACEFGRVYNFPPNIAKCLYNTFKSKRVLDFCSGYGGRLLGFWFSSAEEYVGIDPNSLLVEPYKSIIEELEKKQKKKIKMIQGCAEDINYKELGMFDTIFTSPPYFTTEIYNSKEETQSSNRYPEFDDWLNNFLLKTIKKTTDQLLPNGHLIINIKDHKRYEIIKPMIEFIKKLKLKNVTNIMFKQSKRWSNNKYEYIYVFQK